VVRTIQVPVDQIEVHADIGPGRIISATITVDDSSTASSIAQPNDPGNRSFEDWEKDFNAMCALAPINQFPADVSRESMYLSDDEMKAE
jgi:hypothetical protein